MRSNDVFALARSALTGDREHVRSVLGMMIANAPARSSLSTRLRQLLQSNGGRIPAAADGIRLDKGIESLIRVMDAARGLDSVVLPAEARQTIEAIANEHAAADALAAHNLTPRNRLLFTGAPGTGKTTLAGALSMRLQRPLLAIDYGVLISSYMGETGAKLTKLIDGLAGQRCVLLIDELETLLSERSGRAGRSDVGEQARIVSALLLAMDRLDSRVVLVGATNHPEMLDRAVRRRFDVEIDLPLSTRETAAALGRMLAARHPGVPIHEMIPHGVDGRTFSDIERAVLARAREWVMAGAAAKASDGSEARLRHPMKPNPA